MFDPVALRDAKTLTLIDQYLLLAVAHSQMGLLVVVATMPFQCCIKSMFVEEKIFKPYEEPCTIL